MRGRELSGSQGIPFVALRGLPANTPVGAPTGRQYTTAARRLPSAIGRAGWQSAAKTSISVGLAAVVAGRGRRVKRRRRIARRFFSTSSPAPAEPEVPISIKVDIADEVEEGFEPPIEPETPVDTKLLLICAGFSFDAYTQAERCAGVWTCDGFESNNEEDGILGVQTCLFSPKYVRDAYHGILRIRPVTVEGFMGVPVAGTAAMRFWVTSSSPWALCSSARCSSVRGMNTMDGVARWEDRDESVYIYVPKDCGNAVSSSGKPEEGSLTLNIEFGIRDLFDMRMTQVIGRAEIPCPLFSRRRMQEIEVELEIQREENSVLNEEGEKKPCIARLQVEYDEFLNATSEVGEGGVMSSEELVEDVTPLRRLNRFRWGNAIPAVDAIDVEKMSSAAIQVELRQRALPSLDVGSSELVERLELAMKAEKTLKEAGSVWALVKDSATSVGQVLSGDVTAAVGAALWTGLQEVAGVQELLSGDFKGAWAQRVKVMDMFRTEEGRESLTQRAKAASRLAQQVAMLRLANGMELMSVRRGAWKMLEQAISAADGDGPESETSITFGEYEQLAYLEAASTNTECWVWRLKRKKLLLVTFRGTSDWGDVMVDISTTPVDLGPLGKVHSGFWRAYTSVRPALRAALAAGCEGSAEGWQVDFTGHSLGGALASLAALDASLKARGEPLKGTKIKAVTFGAPRVGDERFCQVYDNYAPDTWRVFSTSDIIPCLPPTSFFGFQHAGIAVELDPALTKIQVKGRSRTLQEEETSMSEEEAQAEARSFWSSFDRQEMVQLQKVLGSGTGAVAEHMEDNYFQRIQECLAEDLTQSSSSDYRTA
mmetsp:Transcript_51158/g.121582  ORF Transcript_51158/g.121582 Transcript_51158/m.121582 type:complete len:825 (+) Transcript_51158:69-2543(+)